MPAVASGGDHAVASALFATAICTAAVALVIAPGAAFFDSGELTATSVELGVPHPTGFSLLNLWGHLFARAPLGASGMRVNLACASAAAMAAVLLLQTLAGSVVLSRSNKALLFLVAGGLFCLAAPSLQRHARSAEIYPLVWLHAAVCAAAVLAPGRKALPRLSALLGVSIGLHALSVLFAGVFGLWALAVALRRRYLGQQLLTGTVGFVSGLLVVAYLPLAASRPPGFSWGDVQSLSALWAHLSAQSIRAAFAHEMGAGFEAASQMLFTGLRRDVGAYGFAAIVGAAWLWRRHRAAFAVAGVLVLVDGVYSVAINPMGLRDEQCGHIVALTSLCLAAIAVVAAAVHVVPRKSHIAAVAAIAAIAGVRCVSVVQARTTAERRAALALGDAVLVGAAPGGLAVVSSDHLASLCTYLQFAEGARPDVKCVPIAFTRSKDMLRVLGRHNGAGFAKAGRRLAAGGDARVMAAAMGDWLRPALRAGTARWEPGSAAEDAQVVSHWLPGFPYGVVTGGAVEPAKFARRASASLAAARRWCGGGGDLCQPGSDSAQLVGRWASIQAGMSTRARRPGAAAFMDLALAVAPLDRGVLNNRAVQLLSQNQPERALQVCRRGLRAHPDHAALHRVATRASLASGDLSAVRYHAAAYLGSPAGRRSGERWLQGLLRMASPEERAALAAAAADR